MLINIIVLISIAVNLPNSVKKKRSGDIARLTDGRRYFEVEEVAEEEPVNGGMKLLANEEFEKESGRYRSDSEEGEPEKLEDIEETPKKTVSKKRKASKKLTRSKYVMETYYNILL